MLQQFEFTKVCMEKMLKSYFSRNDDIFSIKMTYLNALLSFLLSSRFSARSEPYERVIAFRVSSPKRKTITRLKTPPHAERPESRFV